MWPVVILEIIKRFNPFSGRAILRGGGRVVVYGDIIHYITDSIRKSVLICVTLSSVENYYYYY
jgi:hypothetical protein